MRPKLPVKFIFLFFAAVISNNSSAQFSNSHTSLQQNNFPSKGDPNKTIYLATAIPGVVLLATGFAMFLDFSPGADEQKIKTGETLMYIGGGLVLASIPFYIASKRNKGFSARIDIESRKLPQLQGVEIYYSYHPSLSIKISKR